MDLGEILCEHVNEPSDSVEGVKYLEWLSDYQLLKDSAPWSCTILCA
jgi:hypothetical protein